MRQGPYEHEPQEIYAYEDEVHLMDLLEVIWKWKYLVLIGTFLCAAVALVISLQMTKIYRVTTILEPGVVHVDRYGRIVRTCRGQELKNLIESGAFNGRVLSDLNSEGVQDLPRDLGLDADNPKSSDIVTVSYDTPNPKVGIHILNQLNIKLRRNFEGLVNRWKNQYAQELTKKKGDSSELVERIVRRKNEISSARVANAKKISQLQTKIGIAQTRIGKLESDQRAQLGRFENDTQNNRLEMETKKKEIRSLEVRIGDLNREIERISDNTDRLIKERDRFLSDGGGNNDSFASVMYVTTLQQNMAYANDLRSDINDLRSKIFQESLNIEKLATDIKDIQLEKDKLKETTSYQIKDLRMDIRDYENEVESLKKALEIEIGNMESEIKALEIEKESLDQEIKQVEIKQSDVENIQIRKIPTASIAPVKPNIKINVLLSLVVGLFLSAFLSFFLEALSKRKKEKDQSGHTETPDAQA